MPDNTEHEAVEEAIPGPPSPTFGPEPEVETRAEEPVSDVPSPTIEGAVSRESLDDTGNVLAHTEPVDIEDSLFTKMRDMGIDSGQQLGNIATAASQRERVTEILNETREQVALAKKELQALQEASAPMQQAAPPLESSPQAEIPIGGGPLFPLQSFQALSVDEQIERDIGEITKSRHYDYCKSAFQKRLQDPAIRNAIQSGERTVLQEWHDLSNKALNHLMLVQKSRADNILEENRQRYKPPHVESQTSTEPMSKIDRTDEQKRIAEVKQNWKGNDDDVRNLLDAILPPGEITAMRMRDK